MGWLVVSFPTGRVYESGGQSGGFCPNPFRPSSNFPIQRQTTASPPPFFHLFPLANPKQSVADDRARRLQQIVEINNFFQQTQGTKAGYLRCRGWGEGLTSIWNL